MTHRKIQTSKQKLFFCTLFFKRSLEQSVSSHFHQQQGILCSKGNSVLDFDMAWQFLWSTVSSYFFSGFEFQAVHAHVQWQTAMNKRTHTDLRVAARSPSVIYSPLKADYYGANLNYDVEIALEYWAVYEIHRWAQWTANAGRLPCEVQGGWMSNIQEKSAWHYW